MKIRIVKEKKQPNSPAYKGSKGYDDGCDCYVNEAEEDFTPIADPKEPKPEAKQFQILASMITNTKVNDQTNILSAMRALPGVTIVNSQAAIPGSNSEGQLRYKTNCDIKIDTSALEGDVKKGIIQIVNDIKNIDGVVEFKILPKAKETTPY